MGNSISTNQIGGEQQLQEEKFYKSLNDILSTLLKNDMESYLDKSYCKKIKFFVKNDFFMKQSSEILSKLKQDVLVGELVDDQPSKDQLCDKLSHHFLKKINLIASVKIISKKCYDRINELSNGGQCYNKDKKISNLKYKPFFTEVSKIEYGDAKEHEFQKKNMLQFDNSEIRNMTFERLRSDKKGSDILANNNYHLEQEGKKYLLYREIENQSECQEEDGTWLTSKDQLLEHNLIPDKDLSNYNKSFFDVITSSKKNLSSISFKLMEIVNKLIQKKSEDNQNNDTVYINKPITNNELEEYTKEIKKNLSLMITEVEMTYLLVSNMTFITKKEIEEKEKFSKELESLNNKMKETEKQINGSN